LRSIANPYSSNRNLVLENYSRLVHCCEQRFECEVQAIYAVVLMCHSLLRECSGFQSRCPAGGG
jgi:hypothetical protein